MRILDIGLAAASSSAEYCDSLVADVHAKHHHENEQDVHMSQEVAADNLHVVGHDAAALVDHVNDDPVVRVASPSDA